MRVVIVGGAGFIGTALAQSLQSHGLQPIVLDTLARLERSAPHLEGIETAAFDFTCDRTAATLFAGAEALVHLACTTNPAQSMHSVAWDAESNIAPSLRLFDAAVVAGIRRVIFASSGGTVYGAPTRLPVVETDSTRPLSAYGVSKLTIENYLALYPQLEGISLRVANPYGAYQLAGSAVGVIARYMVAVSQKEPIEVWGDGSIVRDYIDITDVVAAFRLAITGLGLPSGTFNIASGVGTSVNEVIGLIFQAAGRDVPVTYLAGRPYDVPAITLDSSRFQGYVSWTAGVSLVDGIAKLWECERLQRERARHNSTSATAITPVRPAN